MLTQACLQELEPGSSQTVYRIPITPMEEPIIPLILLRIEQFFLWAQNQALNKHWIGQQVWYVVTREALKDSVSKVLLVAGYTGRALLDTFPNSRLPEGKQVLSITIAFLPTI